MLGICGSTESWNTDHLHRRSILEHILRMGRPPLHIIRARHERLGQQLRDDHSRGLFQRLGGRHLLEIAAATSSGEGWGGGGGGQFFRAKGLGGFGQRPGIKRNWVLL
jgi:hypothetical protein